MCNLLMDVLEERQRGPTAHFHDCGVVGTSKLEGHGTSSPQGVDSNQGCLDSAFLKFECFDGCSDLDYHIRWGNLVPPSICPDITKHVAGIAFVGKDMVNAVRYCLDRAVVEPCGMVVNGLAHLAIFLVCDLECA